MPVTLTGMGEVASLEDARDRRAGRRRALAEHASRHPALRWMTSTSPPAHRRDPGGGTACGEPGPLTLASPDTALCASCYPTQASG